MDRDREKETEGKKKLNLQMVSSSGHQQREVHLIPFLRSFSYCGRPFYAISLIILGIELTSTVVHSKNQKALN